jgi:chromosomal replication initiator protein
VAQAPASPGAAGQQPNPRYTFDQFVIGGSNRFAHAAALAVAENPGTAYNPLYLCGPPGVGKTHLLHAIATYLDHYAGGLRIRLTSAEGFANEFIGALQGGGIDAFKARHRDVDVLLVDDVQFLMAKARTEEEFFHTFNHLREAGAQIVLTSDRPPRDLAKLEDRLRDRFESGLVAQVLPPDLQTRRAVLLKRAALDGIAPPPADVIDTIAGRITVNLRALEGALIRVVAFASLTSRPVDSELADEVLDELGPARESPGTRRAPTVDEIQRITCQAFGVTHEELLSASRAARVAWPRQVAMYLAREHTGASLPTIGAEFGGRGHTTVLHACRRTAERIAADPEVGQTVADLSTRLSSDPDVTRPDRPE